MTMGERICELRIAHKMSMDELGKYLGVGRSAIHKYEKGLIENIPRDAIEKMAVLFGVSPSYIQCFDKWEETSDALSDEVKLIERIQVKWGKEVVALLHNYSDLNEDGQKTLCNICESLGELNKYKK